MNLAAFFFFFFFFFKQWNFFHHRIYAYYYWGSIPGRVIPKTQKMVLDTALFNIQHYKVRIKGKVEQSREWSSALPFPAV